MFLWHMDAKIKEIYVKSVAHVTPVNTEISGVFVHFCLFTGVHTQRNHEKELLSLEAQSVE